jgi:hypothetical protein
MDAIPYWNLLPSSVGLMTLEAVTAQLVALSRSNPILMIFEDVHWVDPTSLETLGRAVDRLRTRVADCYVPTGVRAAVGGAILREIAALIDGVTGNKSLPESIRQDIIERTDGILLLWRK